MPRRHLMIAVCFGFAALAAAPVSAFAASLYFLPETQTASVGQTFMVRVEVSSIDQALNAVSGEIFFPSDKLRALSVSNNQSNVTLWVQNPSFSNAASGGDVNFAGIILNPGFTGTGANIITIRFQAIATGRANLKFSSGAVLANDGKGTNILTSMGTASYLITPGSAAVPPPPAASSSASSTPPAPPTSTATSTPPIVMANTSTTPASVPNGWLGPTLLLVLSWSLLIILILALLTLIIALVYYLIYRIRRFRLSLDSKLALEREQKELRESMRPMPIPMPMPPKPAADPDPAPADQTRHYHPNEH